MLSQRKSGPAGLNPQLVLAVLVPGLAETLSLPTPALLNLC